MIDIDRKPMCTVHKDSEGKMITTVTPFDDLPYEERYNWYSGICSDEEIKHMLDMKCAHDYILRLRADSIISNTRIFRVVLKHAQDAQIAGNKWSLGSYLTAYGYVEFKNSLPTELKLKAQEVAFGNIFSNEANGLVFESPYGVCSTIGHPIRYFVQFASLALLHFDSDIPELVRLNAMRIAVRTMLGTEALDFDLDPRGIIPENVRQKIYRPYPWISIFIAGHEYSHYLNGDLKPGDTTLQSIVKAHFTDDTDYRKIYCYNTSQQHEFAADLGAMNNPLFSEDYYATYYNYTLLWFTMLAIYESVEDYMFPPFGRPSHPGAKARFQNILEHARRPIDFDVMEDFYTKQLPAAVDYWSEILKQDVAFNTEKYEFYGSVYLASPNTEWRGRELVDRFDY